MKKRRKARMAPPDAEKRRLDLRIGLTLLGTEGREQFCQYLQVRHAQTNWGQTTQAA